MVGCAEAGGEALGALVFGEGKGGDGALEEGILGLGEVFVEEGGLGGQAAEGGGDCVEFNLLDLEGVVVFSVLVNHVV